MKSAVISGLKRGNIWKTKLMSLQNSKNKNKTIRDLYTGIHEFKRGYQPQSNLVKE
jgi:hypothetical protein